MQYRIRNGDTVLATVSDKKYTVEKLAPNTKYTFSVTSVNDADKEGKATTIDVTTRGIRVTIPTKITDETVALDYQEYSLGLVPIGTEPKGMFGGGNKETLSAKVVDVGNDEPSDKGDTTTDDKATVTTGDKTDDTADDKANSDTNAQSDSSPTEAASNEADSDLKSDSASQTDTNSDNEPTDETGDKTVVEITSNFNKMKDNLTMKQLDDGSFAVFEDYKALYFNGKKDK